MRVATQTLKGKKAGIAFERIALNLHSTYRKEAAQQRHPQVLV